MKELVETVRVLDRSTATCESAAIRLSPTSAALRPARRTVSVQDGVSGT